MPSAWISSGWYLPTDRKPAVKEEKSRRKEVDEPEPEARPVRVLEPHPFIDLR